MKHAWMILLVAGLLLIAGCGNGDTATTDRPTDEIVVALQDEALTLDPHEAGDAASMRLVENLYSGLLRYGDDYGKVAPDLAERYEVSDDGLRYTFHLRQGVRFHQSKRTVSSADVKYSIERIIDKGLRAEDFSVIQRMDTPDSRTIILVLKQPFAPLLLNLARPVNAIVNREVVEKNGGSLKSADAGTGPFQLQRRRVGQRTVLEKNPDYHVADLPRVNRLILRPISDETSRTTALRSAEVDLVLDLAEKDVPLVKDAGGIVIDAKPGTFFEYIGLNTTRAPLDDVKVRQAIAWAIDRDAINQVVKLGMAHPIRGGWIRPGYWAHADFVTYDQRDVEGAKELLADAGHADGFDLTLKVGSAFTYQVDAAQMVKQQLRDIGINVDIQALESSVFFNDLGQKDFDLTVVGWVGFVDPDDWTYNLFHSKGKYNQQGYGNQEVDELLERGRRTLDQEQRKAIYDQVQRIVVEEAPMVFLYLNDQRSAYRDWLKHYEVRATAATIGLRDASVERGAGERDAK